MLSHALAPSLLRWRRPVRGWVGALMLLLLALAVEAELTGVLAQWPFLLFLPAALLATALGGWAPGAAVALASAVAVWLLVLHPPEGGTSLAGAVSVLIFLLLAGSGIALTEALLRNAAALATERGRASRLAEGQRTLLHELQHRVANHMQFVSGVLALQSRRVDDAETARMVLQDTVQRLDTLSRIHRRLCDPAIAGGDLAGLVQEISRDLLSAAGADNIACVVDVVPVQLEPERLTALALIITELLTNALKHAFTDGRSGTIAITMRQPARGQYALEVRDDGVGLSNPEPLTKGSGTGLGARILRSLADRLEASFSIRQEDGTVARLEFLGAPPA